MFYGWWIVLSCFLISLYMAGTIFYSLTAFFQPIIEEFGWSYTQISAAASLRGLEMGIFAPVVGFLVDRYGSKMVMHIGILVVGVGLLALSMTQTLFLFYMAFLLVGFGAGGCTSVVVMTVVAKWFKKKVSLALGLAAAGFGSGGLLVPVVVWMIDKFNWRLTLIILGLTAWVILFPLTFFIRNRPEDYGLLPDGEVIPGKIAEETESLPLPSNGPEENISFGEAIKNRDFWFFCTAEAVRLMVLVSIVLHIMPYFDSLGIPRSTSGLVAGGLAFLSVLGRTGFGFLGDYYDKRYITAFSYGLMTMGLIVFTILLKGNWSLFLFLILFAPGYGGGMTMRGALLREYFGTGSYGKILGLAMGIGSFTSIIGPVLAGWVYDTFGRYQQLWTVYIGLSILGILFILGIRPTGKEQTLDDQG